jgi:hypothetical protein
LDVNWWERKGMGCFLQFGAKMWTFFHGGVAMKRRKAECLSYFSLYVPLICQYACIYIYATLVYSFIFITLLGLMKLVSCFSFHPIICIASICSHIMVGYELYMIDSWITQLVYSMHLYCCHLKGFLKFSTWIDEKAG